jgi:sugar phosphate isomerase/epimerase
MQRRTFLMQSTLAAGSIILHSSCGFGSSSKPEPKGPAIGLQLYTVRDEIEKLGIEKVVENIAGIGYTHLEMFGFENGAFFGKTPKEIRNLLYDNGLLTPSGHYYSNDYVTGNDDAWKKACEAALTLDQEYIILPYLEEKLRPADADGYTKFAERLNTLGKISKEQGLQFGYHNHDFEFVYNASAKTDLYSVMLNQTDTALVKMEMDLYWVVYAGGDPVTIFYQQPERFPLFHVKDLDPVTRKNADLGKGTIDFPAIFKHKKTAGLKYYFVEQENYNVSPMDSIEKNFAYAKKMLTA